MDNDARIPALNEKLSSTGNARIVSGNGDLPKVEIATRAASAEIYLHGAQVTSWRPAGSDEVLFLSRKSNWKEGKAIRGGIPVCFPWFRAKADDPKAPTHGFVRTKEWQVESVVADMGESVIVRLSTESDDSTKRWWPFDFRMEYRIAVGRDLRLELPMRNTGKQELRFEEALHTYFNVGDVEKTEVRGLDGVVYLDNRDGNRRKQQSGGLRLAEQTDNAYVDSTADVVILDAASRRRLCTQKRNSNSTIVWNPWQEGATSLADLGQEEWRRMLCVEGGNIMTSAVTMKPEETQTMTVTITVNEDPHN